jgi:hypothetical protein
MRFPFELPIKQLDLVHFTICELATQQKKCWDTAWLSCQHSWDIVRLVDGPLNICETGGNFIV